MVGFGNLFVVEFCRSSWVNGYRMRRGYFMVLWFRGSWWFLVFMGDFLFCGLFVSFFFGSLD